MQKLDLEYFQLELGQVRTITKDSGKTVQSIELLLGDQTKAEMMLNDAQNLISFIVRDTQLAEVPELECMMNKDTLRNFIVGLKNLYNNMTD